MDPAYIKALVLKIPLILKHAVLHILSLSSTSSKWDLKTEIVVNVLRSFTIAGSAGRTVDQIQKISLTPHPVKGQMWISRARIPPPNEDDLRQTLFRAINDLKEDAHDTYTPPSLVTIEAEWTGYRANAGRNTPEPSSMSEADKYQRLMAETTSDMTILYFHGGAYYLCDPITHRGCTSKLAQLTGGRVLSIRYRLAPQHPFPAALLDALAVYIALLYPPPGSIHQPVDPRKIVFAGDSAGGNLALVLTLLLLQINRSPPSSTPSIYHNHVLPHPLPLPAGVATNSPWTDLTHSCPSTRATLPLRYDYLRTPNINHNMRYTPSASWPVPAAAGGPRADLFTDASMLCHPLVSPLAAPEALWAGAPPMFACMGEELLGDEGRLVMRRVARANGGRVRWEGFEAMPHCFALVLLQLKAKVGDRCFEGWARFCTEVLRDALGTGEGEENNKGTLTTGGVWIAAKTLRESPVELEALTELKDEEAIVAMRAARDEKKRVFTEWLATKGENYGANGTVKH